MQRSTGKEINNGKTENQSYGGKWSKIVGASIFLERKSLLSSSDGSEHIVTCKISLINYPYTYRVQLSRDFSDKAKQSKKANQFSSSYGRHYSS
jgi:hypothetical protein